MPSADYYQARYRVDARCRQAHVAAKASGATSEQLTQLWNTHTAELHRWAQIEHDRLAKPLKGTLRAVLELHAPHPGWKLALDCQGCDVDQDAYRLADWPCKTWVLIEAGET